MATNLVIRASVNPSPGSESPDRKPNASPVGNCSGGLGWLLVGSVLCARVVEAGGAASGCGMFGGHFHESLVQVFDWCHDREVVDRGEPISADLLRSGGGLRTEQVAKWRSGGFGPWARSVTITRIVDTRYVVEMSGRCDWAGCRAYETLEAAEEVAARLKETPDGTGQYHEWREGSEPGEPWMRQ